MTLTATDSSPQMVLGAVNPTSDTTALPSAPTAATSTEPTGFGVDATAAKILVIDDEPINIVFVRNILVASGYRNVLALSDAPSAMATIERERPDVVLLDIVMPQVSGLEILSQMRTNPQIALTPVIILTAAGDEATRSRALELGATDLLGKPIRPTELLPRVRNALVVKAHHDYLRGYAQQLERQVRQRTAELNGSRLELIHCLARIAEYRDNETGRHVIRVGRYAGIIARKLGLEESAAELIEHAAPLHDIGKIGIPDAILLKPGQLTPDEFELMQRHAAIGRRTFQPMSSSDWKTFRSHTLLGEMIMDLESSPLIAMAGEIALTHHEKWDGSGYPLGLSGEDIPLSGRIIAVADVFDALSSRRPYKPAFPLERCFAILEEGRGKHFDPHVLQAFLDCRDQVVQVRIEYADLE